MRGQTNFIKTIYKSKDAYNMEPLLRDHEDPFKYGITLPPPPVGKVDPKSLYVHQPAGRKGRAIDKSTEDFVDRTRMGVSA